MRISYRKFAWIACRACVWKASNGTHHTPLLVVSHIISSCPVRDIAVVRGKPIYGRYGGHAHTPALPPLTNRVHAPFAVRFPRFPTSKNGWSNGWFPAHSPGLNLTYATHHDSHGLQCRHSATITKHLRTTSLSWKSFWGAVCPTGALALVITATSRNLMLSNARCALTGPLIMRFWIPINHFWV